MSGTGTGAGAALPVVTLNIDYEAELDSIKKFINKFSVQRRVRVGADDEDDEDAMMFAEEVETTVFKYREQLQRIANREQDMLEIELDDVMESDDTNELVPSILRNTQRYVKLFSQAVDDMLPEPTTDLSAKADILDVIQHQRREKNAENAESGEAVFPPSLLRRYNLYFKPTTSERAIAVREVRGQHLGKLITIRGIVTRTSEVKPLLLVNAYTCDICGAEIFQEVDKRKLTPLTECPSDECKQNGAKGQLHMQTRASKFTPFQECKIQEMADQVPVGHIPRSMTIHLYGNQTRTTSPGDEVHITGVFLPIPYEGMKAMRLGLLTDSFLEAHHVRQLRKHYDAMKLTPEIQREIQDLQSDDGLYDKLAGSIAPEIFGHTDVKKALLLLLVGGVTKQMGDGMKIRGDINVCLMGDPGVAKSQLLKFISKIAPRGVYTTGRGSSGVGLTAAVLRDPVTDELVLEGGALVLADNGIACIDEFDKMEESDRTAIHEVMEQQTISISKAGITTTLNARTSILAAANPLYGRYNPKISPVENINLPAALLSRFDLLFLILDSPNRDDDERLAQHVTYVHMHSEHPPLASEPLSPHLMRHFIALARTYRPIVPPEIGSYVVGAYVQLRRHQRDDDLHGRAFTFTSARTLLGILRLSQALARLRFSTEVERSDVDEALRLMEFSKASLMDEETADRILAGADQTATSKIYQIIKQMALAGRGLRRMPRGGVDNDDDEDEEMADAKPDAPLGRAKRGMDLDSGFRPVQRMLEIKDRVIAKGFTETQLEECISAYADLDVWSVEANGSLLRFINDDDD